MADEPTTQAEATATLDALEAGDEVEKTEPTETPETPEVPEAAAAPEADSEGDAETTEVAEGSTPEAAHIAETLHTLKIDGEETQVSTADLIALAQKAGASDARFASAAEQTRQLEALAQTMIDDPKAAFEKLTNRSFNELAKETLIAEYERQNMPPEQRKLLEEREQLARDRAEHESQQETFQREQEERQTAVMREEFTKFADESITSAGLKDSSFLRSRANAYMLSFYQNNQPLTQENLGLLLKDDFEKEVKEAFQALSLEEKAQLLGEEGVKGIRQIDLRQFRGGGLPTTPSLENQPQQATRTEKAKVERMTAEKAKSYLDDLEFAE